MSITISTVLEKLAQRCLTYPYFIQHKDGDNQNNAVSNLCYIVLKDAWRNIDMTVDWWMYLDFDEVDHVLKTLSRSSTLEWKRLLTVEGPQEGTELFVHQMVAATFLTAPNA